eukprot:tig00000411_g515.t1
MEASTVVQNAARRISSALVAGRPIALALRTPTLLKRVAEVVEPAVASLLVRAHVVVLPEPRGHWLVRITPPGAQEPASWGSATELPASESAVLALLAGIETVVARFARAEADELSAKILADPRIAHLRRRVGVTRQEVPGAPNSIFCVYAVGRGASRS